LFYPLRHSSLLIAGPGAIALYLLLLWIMPNVPWMGRIATFPFLPDPKPGGAGH